MHTVSRWRHGASNARPVRGPDREEVPRRPRPCRRTRPGGAGGPEGPWHMGPAQGAAGRSRRAADRRVAIDHERPTTRYEAGRSAPVPACRKFTRGVMRQFATAATSARRTSATGAPIPVIPQAADPARTRLPASGAGQHGSLGRPAAGARAARAIRPVLQVGHTRSMPTTKESRKRPRPSLSGGEQHRRDHRP